MAILNQKKILNLIPKVSAPVTIHVSQGDVGTQIEFTLVKGDEVFVNPGNVTASVHGIREDGANFGPFTCTLSGSKVTFPLHSEMTAVKGSALAEIVLVDNGGNKVGSANFGVLVEESVFPLGVTYDNDVSVYESILNYVQSIPAQLENALSTTNANLASEISARTNADTLINKRIDELIAPSGEAPNPQEIIDARIGADNVTYDTLGDALRGQVTTLKMTLENEETLFYNGVTKNAIINSDGSVVQNNYYFTSDFIEVNENIGTVEVYNKTGASSTIISAYYDSSKNYIANTYDTRTVNPGRVFNYNSEAKYIRFSASLNVYPNIRVKRVPVSSSFNLNFTNFEYGTFNEDGITPLEPITYLRLRTKQPVAISPNCRYDIIVNPSEAGKLRNVNAFKVAVHFLRTTTTGRISYLSLAETPISFRTPSDCNYINIVISKLDSTQNISIVDLEEIIIKPRISEDVVYNNKHFLEEAKYIDFEKGSLDSSGFPRESIYGYPRLRATGYTKVIPGDRIRVEFAVSTEETPITYASIYSDKESVRLEHVLVGRGGIGEYVVPSGINYMRFVLQYSGNTEILPSDIIYYRVTCDKNSIPLRFFAPVPLKETLKYVKDRVTNQDIVVYDGNIVECDTGFIKVNGGSEITLDNGHGNNANFGKTVHGTFPYLYCPTWEVGDKRITVFEITSSTATLVKEIEYEGLPSDSHLNACVDEQNSKAYIFMSQQPLEGDVKFYVGDLDGNLLTNGKTLDFPIKVIQGMTFVDGYIYMVSGSTNVEPEQYLWIFNTDGEVVSKALILTDHEIEGVSYDPINDALYIARIDKMFKD